MRDRWAELAARDARALVISFAPPKRLAGYRAHLALPFPIAADVDRRAYAAYGLGRGSTLDVWHPRTLLRYLRLLAGGMKLARPAEHEDLSQLGGDFIVDDVGLLRYAHRSRRPDDRPPVAALLRALDELRPGAAGA